MVLGPGDQDGRQVLGCGAGQPDGDLAPVQHHADDFVRRFTVHMVSSFWV